MDQHPVPRQITTFEFKLIGFLTIKQFIYLIVFIGLGLIVYGLTPIPILNILFGATVAGAGAAFAFIPINDRPMEIWVKNLIKRLTSPTQYIFRKENKPLVFLLGEDLSSNPQLIATHIDSQQKLNSYLTSKTPTTPTVNKKQLINNLFTSPMAFLGNKKPTIAQQTGELQKTDNPPQVSSPTKHPFITGLVKNHRETPLAGVLIYVKKNPTGEPIRILKSNAHGVFLSYNPLPPSEYFFEVKDPKHSYIFDTIKIKVENENNKPLEIRSKELI